MSPRLAFAIESAYQAGRSTLAYFQTELEVESKADDSPVTIADREAERIIRQRIAEKYPGESILGEEEGGPANESEQWVIDPIDGTKSFIAGVPLFATLLSWEVGGQAAVAACYLPALDEMFYAEEGGGAFLNGRPIRVSDCPRLSEALICSGNYHSMVRANRLHGFQNLADKSKSTRGWCDAYGHMLVAAGRADAMIDPLVSHWDVSSPSLIVREAGGVWMDFTGNSQLASEAISCAPSLREDILQEFR